MNKLQLLEKIIDLYAKWSCSSEGLNEYEKLALKKYEEKYKLLNL